MRTEEANGRMLTKRENLVHVFRLHRWLEIVAR